MTRGTPEIVNMSSMLVARHGGSMHVVWQAVRVLSVFVRAHRHCVCSCVLSVSFVCGAQAFTLPRRNDGCLEVSAIRVGAQRPRPHQRCARADAFAV